MYRVCHPDKKQSGSNDTKCQFLKTQNFLCFCKLGLISILRIKLFIVDFNCGTMSSVKSSQ